MPLRTFTKFVPAEGVVYRLPESSESMSVDLKFYQQLLDHKAPTKSPLPGMDVVAQSRHNVVEGGRTWTDIEMTLKVVAGDREQRMRFRVDPDDEAAALDCLPVHRRRGGDDPLRLPRPRPGRHLRPGRAAHSEGSSTASRPTISTAFSPGSRPAASGSTTTGRSMTGATARTPSASGARDGSGGPSS